jgi:hypothetical protein
MTEDTLEKTKEQIKAILDKNSRKDAFDKIVALTKMKLEIEKNVDLIPYINGYREPEFAIRFNSLGTAMCDRDWRVAQSLIENVLNKREPKKLPFHPEDQRVLNDSGLKYPTRARKPTSASARANKMTYVPQFKQNIEASEEQESVPLEKKEPAVNLSRFIKIDHIKELMLEMATGEEIDEELFAVYKMLIKAKKEENKEA